MWQLLLCDEKEKAEDVGDGELSSAVYIYVGGAQAAIACYEHHYVTTLLKEPSCCLVAQKRGPTS